MSSLKSVVDPLFGFSHPVGRELYLRVGVLLMALKLSVDLTVLYVATGRWWWPWEMLSWLRLEPAVPNWAIQVLLLWALPFAWVGLSMSVRRAIDAGLSPWIGLLFCVPVVNFALMIGLCFPATQAFSPRKPAPDLGPGSPFQAIGASLLLAIAVTLVSIFGLEDLGVVLFVGTPLGMGVVAGYTYNRGTTRSLKATLFLAISALIVAAAVLLLFAIEGVFCIAMMLPLAVPLALLGALLGRGVAVSPAAHGSPLVILLLALPLGAWVEPSVRTERLHEVTSRVVIDASPEEVWANVVSFKPLAPPRELWFRLGIAYPTQARIEGTGVGAVRTCEFSTGRFVEPITVWDEPWHLAFDVTEQPEPLRELSPYPSVHADHRKSSLTSRRGEFRLSVADDGQTVLEGTTWYELSIFPEVYWSLWTDFLVRSIHLRVLRHIQAESELGHESSAV